MNAPSCQKGGAKVILTIPMTPHDEMVSCVHMYTTFKRIELESPGCSGLVTF